ncbi:MAG: carboxypeptidase-like regulatory domain-containing protein [Candidatus Zixiibacteriota bacterium]|jgi:hypothetical protein
MGKMKERFLILFLAASTAVGGAFAQAEPEKYSSKEYGIYFDVPAGWTLDKKAEGSLFALRDSLGLIEIKVTARIIANKKDIREFAKGHEAGRGLSGKGAVLADMVKNETYAEATREALKPFVYDDIEATDKARKKHAENAAKAAAGEGGGEGGGSIPDEGDFLATKTTRLYEAEDLPTTEIIVYVIGGGVGYTVSIGAGRDDFYAVLPMARDAVAAMKLDRLSGGRYALPDGKAIEAAKKGIIMGKVLRNGRPVIGAAVNLYVDAAAYNGGVPSHSSRSNGYGEYTFTQLNGGRYYLLEVYGVSDEGIRVRSVQPIKNIDVTEGRVKFVNIEVAGAQ